MTPPIAITILFASLFIVFTMANTSLSAAEANLTDEEKKAAIHKIYLKYRKKFPKVVDIAADKAMELARQQRVVFVDTRKPDEQLVSMLPNAVTPEMLDKDPSLIDGKAVVAYCTIGYRSGVLAEKMTRQGIHFQNLAGGILAWIHAGGQVYDAQGQTHRVHVYGKTWDYAPHGYQTVMFGFFGQIMNSK